MSQKRKHDEVHEDSSSVPKPFKKYRAFKPSQSHEQPKHRKRPNISHDNENGRTPNALKSRIRDLKRLLVHIDNVPKHRMSAGARQERERELEACEHELAEKIKASREAEYRDKMIGKYHQVRFFDRQKGTRILKRLKKEESTEEDEAKKAKLQHRIHNAEVDVNYATYYPLMKVYSSLYPKSKKQKNDTHDDEDEAETEHADSKNKGDEVDGPRGNVEMWKAVEQAMEEGTLDALRNSKDAIPAAPPKKSKATKDREAQKRKEIHTRDNAMDETPARQGPSHAGDEESDDGFFE